MDKNNPANMPAPKLAEIEFKCGDYFLACVVEPMFVITNSARCPHVSSENKLL